MKNGVLSNATPAPSPAAINPTYLDRAFALAGRFNSKDNRAMVRTFLAPVGGEAMKGGL